MTHAPATTRSRPPSTRRRALFPPPDRLRTVEHRTVGTPDLVVSVVGLGCNNFGGRLDFDQTRAVVEAALDAGITFFDTADVYGNRGGSERFLGEILEGR